MNNLGYVKEGTLHRKLRYTRYKYRMYLATTVLVGVVAVAAALIIPAHYNKETAVAAEESVECEPSLKAGIVRTTEDLVLAGAAKADRIQKANLIDFDQNSEWASDSFVSFVNEFEDWCFKKEQLSINFKHTCVAGDTTATLSNVTNVVNPGRKTGYVTALKPTYSLGMYYNYDSADYYATIVADATDHSSDWVHISPESNDAALDFCQGSVISTTSVTTVHELLKYIATSGDYATTDGVYESYALSWCGDIDNQLLTPTFSATADSYITRIDFQNFEDVVYCTVTYVYNNNTAGITEESYAYSLLRSNNVMNWEVPTYIRNLIQEDTTSFDDVIKEI